MRIVPTQCALGAELQGIDLAQDLIEDDVLKARSAWLDHGVVFFRNQAITDKMLVRFSRRIGEPEPSPASERARVGSGSAAEFPEVWVISNVVENGKPIGSLGSGEAEWHTDMSYAARPPIASVLHALEIPLTGGDTHFAIMYDALSDLPEELLEKIQGRQANHDSSHTSSGELRVGADPVVDVTLGPGCPASDHLTTSRHRSQCALSGTPDERLYLWIAAVRKRDATRRAVGCMHPRRARL